MNINIDLQQFEEALTKMQENVDVIGAQVPKIKSIPYGQNESETQKSLDEYMTLCEDITNDIYKLLTEYTDCLRYISENYYYIDTEIAKQFKYN